ncbi:MAG: hypothetical protein FWH38_05765, partial [Treponema sp.]|nr:hypothetical protein [Treponema sp.]
MENEAGDGGSGFFIDPAIPIPAEIPEGEENLNLEELSWEMIISGMLHVISGGPGTSESPVKSEWADYYRRFVLAVRPAIMGELTEAAILKARNGDFDLALEILGALRGLFPSSPVVKVNRALVMEERAAHMEKRGRAEAGEAFSAAESAYDEALAAEPPFPGAFLNAGFFCLNRKDFRRAREYFERYTEIAEDGDKKEQAQEIVRDIDRSGLEDECYSEACELIRQGKDEEGMLRIRG